MQARPATFFIISVLNDANVPFTFSFDPQEETVAINVGKDIDLELTFEELDKLEVDDLKEMVQVVIDPSLPVKEPTI